MENPEAEASSVDTRGQRADWGGPRAPALRSTVPCLHPHTPSAAFYVSSSAAGDSSERIISDTFSPLSPSLSPWALGCALLIVFCHMTWTAQSAPWPLPGR